ncbi:MAG: UvrB/UvrC motif-containing protein [Candidatus Latescibacteria bacterium]|nr:UvrB/UvrC motif-containing protein [Candidatus Latescibacterota bacterium]
MVCQKCGKKPAVVILTQIANNKKSVLYLCEECAKKMGISVASSEEHTAEEAGAKANSAAEDKNLRCPTCGLSYADFKQNGRLGCGDCYSAFSEPLEKVLTKLHGSTVHRGKVPLQGEQRVRIRRDIIKLRKELKAAIEKERFEEAARLRDKLAEMERIAQNDN